jgi:hypothetical protein
MDRAGVLAVFAFFEQLFFHLDAIFIIQEAN